MGKPDYDFPPGREPEKPWPIDPRPAIRDLMLFGDAPPFRKQTSRERRWVMFGGLVLLTFAVTRYWIDRSLRPPLPPYVSREKLAQVEKGMSQKEVLGILGEPPGKTPDCWTYSFSDEQKVCIYFGSMFKVSKIECVKKRLRDSKR
jgi:hypothetical protein